MQGSSGRGKDSGSIKSLILNKLPTRFRAAVQTAFDDPDFAAAISNLERVFNPLEDRDKAATVIAKSIENLLDPEEKESKTINEKLQTNLHQALEETYKDSGGPPLLSASDFENIADKLAELNKQQAAQLDTEKQLEKENQLRILTDIRELIKEKILAENSPFAELFNKPEFMQALDNITAQLNRRYMKGGNEKLAIKATAEIMSATLMPSFDTNQRIPGPINRALQINMARRLDIGINKENEEAIRTALKVDFGEQNFTALSRQIAQQNEALGKKTETVVRLAALFNQTETSRTARERILAGFRPVSDQITQAKKELRSIAETANPNDANRCDLLQKKLENHQATLGYLKNGLQISSDWQLLNKDQKNGMITYLRTLENELKEAKPALSSARKAISTFAAQTGLSMEAQPEPAIRTGRARNLERLAALSAQRTAEIAELSTAITNLTRDIDAKHVDTLDTIKEPFKTPGQINTWVDNQLSDFSSRLDALKGSDNYLSYQGDVAELDKKLQESYEAVKANFKEAAESQSELLSLEIAELSSTIKTLNSAVQNYAPNTDSITEPFESDLSRDSWVAKELAQFTQQFSRLEKSEEFMKHQANSDIKKLIDEAKANVATLKNDTTEQAQAKSEVLKEEILGKIKGQMAEIKMSIEQFDAASIELDKPFKNVNDAAEKQTWLNEHLDEPLSAFEEFKASDAFKAYAEEKSIDALYQELSSSLDELKERLITKAELDHNQMALALAQMDDLQKSIEGFGLDTSSISTPFENDAAKDDWVEKQLTELKTQLATIESSENYRLHSHKEALSTPFDAAQTSLNELGQRLREKATATSENIQASPTALVLTFSKGDDATNRLGFINSRELNNAELDALKGTKHSAASASLNPSTQTTSVIWGTRAPRGNTPYTPADNQLEGLAYYCKFCERNPSPEINMNFMVNWDLKALSQAMDCCWASGRSFEFDPDLRVTIETGVNVTPPRRLSELLEGKDLSSLPPETQKILARVKEQGELMTRKNALDEKIDSLYEKNEKAKTAPTRQEKAEMAKLVAEVEHLQAFIQLKEIPAKAKEHLHESLNNLKQDELYKGQIHHLLHKLQVPFNDANFKAIPPSRGQPIKLAPAVSLVNSFAATSGTKTEKSTEASEEKQQSSKGPGTS